jgi:uncharacterized protein (TIGR03545 family)
MKMIRWGGLITFIVIIGLIAAFDLFFLDTIIERSLERQGSLIVGARVDIGELDFSLFDLHLAIKDLQVTDPEHPMLNAVESGEIFINLAAAPLLKKKIVIENMTVRNIALNTPRKTSGALPPRLNRIRNKVAAPEKEPDAPASATNRLEECSLPDFSAVADIRNRSPEDILSGVKLKSSEFLSEYVNKVSATRQSWKTRLEALPTKESLNADLKSLKELINEKPKNVTELPGYLEKIKVLKNRVQSSKQALTAAGKDFQSDMSSLRESLSSANIEKLKSQDLSAVMKKLDIKIPSSEDLVCVLVGKDIARKITTALSWYRKLNGLMPAGKGGDAAEKPRQVPRMKGVDVAFPVTHGYPDFLLEKAAFSTRSDVPSLPEGVAFSKLSGTFEGLTTQPYLYGKPAVFNISGALAGGGARELLFKGTMDHRTEPADDSFTLSVKEIKIRRTETDDSETAPLQIASADITMNSGLKMHGGSIEGRTVLTVLNPEVAVGSKAAAFKDLFKNTGPFDVFISIGGTLEQPSMALSSSLTKTLKSGLENIVREKLSGLEKNIKTYIATRVDAEREKADSETNSLEKSINGTIAERLELAGRILKEASGQDTSPTDVLKKKGLPLPF